MKLPAKPKTSITRAKKTRDNETGLTEQQETFCRLVAEGNNTLVNCYQLAYPNDNSNRNTMACNASRLHVRKVIKDRIQLIRDAIVAKCPVTKLEAMSRLAEIIRGDDDDRAIQAIRELKSLVPEWTDGSSEEKPEAIQITILSQGDQPNTEIVVEPVS